MNPALELTSVPPWAVRPTTPPRDETGTACSAFAVGELAREVAEAIAAGHAQGVAHGRLNPEAVLVTHAGAVKLIGYVVDASLHPPVTADPLYGALDELSAALGPTGRATAGVCIHCNRCMPTIYSGTRCPIVTPEAV